MEVKFQELISRINNVCRVKIAFISTILFFFFAHGYAMTNYMPSHDSLMLISEDDPWKISLGRWVNPYYSWLMKNRVNAPWLTLCIACLFIFVMVCVISELLDFSNVQVIILSGILSVNLTTITLFANYMHEGDVQILAMLFSCIAVFVFDQCKRMSLRILSILFICLGLGCYQSSLNMAIGLFILVMIKKVILDQYSRKELLSYGVLSLFVIFLGCLLYLAMVKAFLFVYGIEGYDGINGPGKVLSLSPFVLVKMVFGGAGFVFKTLIDYFFVMKALKVNYLYILIFAFGMALILYMLIGLRKNLMGIVALVVLFILFPIGINALFFVTLGYIHPLMLYSYNLVLVFFLFVMQNQKTMLKNNLNKRILSRVVYIARGALVGTLLLYLYVETVYANEVYLYRDMVYKQTSYSLNEIYSDICKIEEYIDGETKVVFLSNGNDYGNLDYRNSSFESRLYPEPSATGLYSTAAITYQRTIDGFYYYCLGKKVNVVYVTEPCGESFIAGMPCYPHAGYCVFEGDSVYVKLSE